MKSVVSLAPGKPEVILYWADPDNSRGLKPWRQPKRGHKSRFRRGLENLGDREEDPIQSRRRGYALPR